MCRNSKTGSGRRCPAHSNPANRQLANKRKREKYARDKASAANQLTPAPEVAPELVSAPNVTLEVRKNTEKDMSIFGPDWNQNTWAGDISDEERNAVVDYSNLDFAHINKYCYSPEFKEQIDSYDPSVYPVSYKPGTPEEEQEKRVKYRDQMLNMLSLVSSAVSKGGFKTEVPIYRGEVFDVPEGGTAKSYIEENFKVGSRFKRLGLVSTSINPSVAVHRATNWEGENLGKVMFEMKTTEGAYIRPIAGIGSEDEILLPRKKQWRVAAVSENVQYETVHIDDDNDRIVPTGETTGITVVHLVEIPYK